MENEFLKVQVNPDGTLDLHNKTTGRSYNSLNYLSDQGENGNAWKHVSPLHDRKYSSLGVLSQVAVTVSGPLSSTIEAEYEFAAPADYGDGESRSRVMAKLPVKVAYTLEKGAKHVLVKLTVDNRAKDHWLRANFLQGCAPGLLGPTAIMMCYHGPFRCRIPQIGRNGPKVHIRCAPLST